MTSHVLHRDVPLGWYQPRFFSITSGHSWEAWGGERGHPWYGTFAKPKGYFTEGMFEKCWCCLPVRQNCSHNVSQNLSDPRNRNHKSLAIANHNFEVASLSRRNRNEIAVLQVLSESQWFFLSRDCNRIHVSLLLHGLAQVSLRFPRDSLTVASNMRPLRQER